MSGPIRSSLGRFAGSMRDPDPANALRKAKEAYDASDGEIVLINRAWLSNWTDQKQLDLLAVKAYGLDKGKV
ncbi:hypothetical protein [Erythrobacter sp. SG61-1L]|uniref:hypothetical protein n=1 Tax=Erythrobacter sp. SG61-1L TaxID=1603897 RepID=UPI0012E2DDB2|nr:hypothetical protein [Erythrobacter sp. SG61-1L]